MSADLSHTSVWPYSRRSLPVEAPERVLAFLHLAMSTDPKSDPHTAIVLDGPELPAWQRGDDWSNSQKVQLIASISRHYPINQIVLWRKPNGVRVPIDGKQRLATIRRFMSGHLVMPRNESVPQTLRGRAYRTPDGSNTPALEQNARVLFDNYHTSILQYDAIDEEEAMRIFVKLQGRRHLRKPQIRAALGGEVSSFVGSVAGSYESGTGHAFFQALDAARDFRRGGRYRNLCDMLLHEFLYPGKGKHWTLLEEMYVARSRNLSARDKSAFESALTAFHRALLVEVKDVRALPQQVRQQNLTVSLFKVFMATAGTGRRHTTGWLGTHVMTYANALTSKTVPHELIELRSYLKGGADGADNIAKRHGLLMHWFDLPETVAAERDPRRRFSCDERQAVFDRSSGRCEWIGSDGERCINTFRSLGEADIDHHLPWGEGGRTQLSNARALCRQHNRSGSAGRSSKSLVNIPVRSS